MKFSSVLCYQVNVSLLKKVTIYKNKQLLIVLNLKDNNIFMHLNAFFKHLNYVNIVSQLEILRYEISIHFCFVLDFFEKV